MDRPCGSQTRFSLGLAFILALVVGSLGSSLATFSDDKCLNSLEGIDGPNGYPNGTCTPLDIKGPAWKSFQIVGLDHGCTPTIYGKDEDPTSPCSSKTLEFAHIATCYNRTWVYYSIDFCDVPNGTPSPLASAVPQSSPGNHTGAIAGGIVGGVCGIALVVGLVFWYVRRNRDGQRAGHRDLPSTPPLELPSLHAKQEIHSNQAYPPQEIGRSSVLIGLQKPVLSEQLDRIASIANKV
ncbi:uncharacterized protein CC84DRAFT_1186812 [Paraphaeosphaeria sporulosa]|uniref:Uncharacterized protein n=1 Tax=Paraphaeosphaeria sporulosa TaxID=1460663 RepID=A0A177CF97_9PLEO|nr:uncharacterized protein CC84DRAFT_1186812 [Paraphaeosphaeria sporulosa]OAG05612.1 hypothetical protein CC84DRAFT_1186812 [Paraphaeosphaeria sporulosa]